MNDIEKLLNDYLSWYQKKYSIKQLKDAHEIVTPFVNHINDRISLFVEFEKDGSVVITDDGVTIDELNMHGLDLQTAVRQKILKDTLKNFNLELEGEIISVKVEDQKQFMQAKHNLIQGILQIYDLVFTTRSNVSSLFKEEVLNYFFEHDFAGTPGPDLLGASGIKHSVDYSMGATRKRPLTLVKLLQSSRFNDVAAQKYISEDLKNGLSDKKTKVRYVVIVNDVEHSVPKKSELVAKDIGIDLLPWSDKKRIESLK